MPFAGAAAQAPEAPTASDAAATPAARRTWRTPKLEDYRGAIENYAPVVQPHNQRALRERAPTFARYLVAIHARLHPIFADTLLNALDRLPPEHPLNDPNLAVTLELALDSQTGRLIRRGVIETSGSTAFDVNAIAAVERAGPFGPPPSATLSSDGNFYVHWTFRRDCMACSTCGAHPYRLER